MLDTANDRYFRQLCENLGVAVIATDLDLNIQTWNAAAARTFGAGAERMIRTPLVKVIPQDRRHLAERMFRRAIRTGETIQLEFEHRDAMGRRRELAGTIAPVLGDGGARIGASICIRDITRRIELQGEVHENRKMAALGEMAGAIAHHFNNILGGAITSLDYAATSDDPTIQHRVFEQVGASLQRAASLVRSLLAFAQGDHTHTDERGRPVESADLSDVLAQVCEDIRRSIEGSGIQFELIGDDNLTVPVARGPLSTVLENITRNAIEAMPEGGKLTLEVARGVDAVTIVVSDTGCGLDEHAKSRMFEPFWSTKSALGSQHAIDGGRPDRQAAGPAEARGLGLAIAHGLIRMMGGTIAVQSQKAKGASFHISLPIRPS